MKQTKRLEPKLKPSTSKAPPLLVNSDLDTHHCDQASSEFTRRGGWGVRSFLLNVSCKMLGLFHRRRGTDNWLDLFSPHHPAPSPHKFGHRLISLATLIRPNLRGEGELEWRRLYPFFYENWLGAKVFQKAVSLLVFFAFLLSLGSNTFAVQEAEKTIYLAPDDHTDYFWTADDVQYRAAFIETLDYYLGQIDKTQNDPDPFQTRWNCDGTLWLWEYEHNKSAAEFERLMKRVADGHISCPLNALVSTYGAQPAEAVLRGMYYAGDLERRFGVRFPMAVSMENQTLPQGLGALWAGAGARYSWKGICGCATKMPYPDFQRRDHEVYWWRGLDGSRILMKWYSLGDSNESLGGYAEARKPNEAVAFINQNKAFAKRHPWQTFGLFGYGWDDLKTLSDRFPKDARRLTNERQKIVVSNMEDYFRAFERKHGGQIPVESRAYGNEWDLLCASMAEQTARVRRAVEKLRAAEAISVFVARQDPTFWTQRKKQRDQAYLNLGLYWEHDWTSDASEEMRQKRAVWQKKLADQVSAYVDELYADGVAAMGKLVPAAGSDGISKSKSQSFAIFNPLGHVRSGVVQLDVSNKKIVDVVEQLSGKSLAWHRVSGTTLAVEVDSVPAMGMKVIVVKQGDDPKANVAIEKVDPRVPVVLENDKLRVTITRGRISGLFSKVLGRELAGACGLNLLVDEAFVSQRGIKVSSIAKNAANSVTITIDSPVACSTTVSLTGENDWIDIENRIEENFSKTLSWEFDFANSSDFQLHHEEVGAILRAETEADGGHYAGRNARYDWLTAGHHVNLSDKTAQVTVSNLDCCFFKFGDSSPRSLDTKHSRVRFLIGGQIDGANLGIRSQNGDTSFVQRFSVGVNPVDKNVRHPMEWALERTNPLVAIALPTNSTQKSKRSGNPLEPLVEVSQREQDLPNSVMLWALKPAEDYGSSDTGKIVLRLWNVANEPRDALVKVNGLKNVQAVTHIETPFDPARMVNEDKVEVVPGEQLSVKLSGQQMRTFLLEIAD